MDQFQRSWKPGKPNSKYPGGIPCHRHQNEDDEDFEQLTVGPRDKNKAFKKLNSGAQGPLSGPSNLAISSKMSRSKCISCCKKFKNKSAVTKQPDSLHSDSICGVCSSDYPEINDGTNASRTRKITKPIERTTSTDSAEIKIVKNASRSYNDAQPPELEESSSSCGICIHTECKKPPRSDLALILSVLDKNKGCVCGTVARALRTGVHGYMRIGHRFSGSPLPPELETIDSEPDYKREDSNDVGNEVIDGIDEESKVNVDETGSKTGRSDELL